jgi:RNA 3'-terminal phosphate cyclase
MATIRRSTAASPVSASSTKAKDAVQLSSIKNADTGLKTKFDAKKQTLTLSGTARGLETRRPGDTTSTFAERERQSDYEKMEQFGGSISLDFDHDKMPKFDTSAGYTEKNKWYFAHGASVGTKRGQTAEQVANSLAAKINENRSYRAVVKSNSDGSATLSVERR